MVDYTEASYCELQAANMDVLTEKQRLLCGDALFRTLYLAQTGPIFDFTPLPRGSTEPHRVLAPPGLHDVLLVHF